MDWSAFRAHFPVTRHWAFLDHAAVAPLPDTAVAALDEYALSLADHGIAAIRHWVGRVAHVRELAAQLVNAPSVDDICFVPSTTTGIGMIAEGFPWQPGDNVVIPADEYPSNQYPWLNLASRGVEVRYVPTRDGRITIDDIRDAMNDRTRLLSISAVEYGTGFRNDLNAIGELCRERGVFFFVDAIQALGAFPIDLQQTPIDALAADGHKWMLAPEGAGFAYIRREWIERLRVIGVGAHSVVKPFDYHVIDFTLKPHAGRWEGGCLNMPGIAALGGSLGLLLDAGIDNIAEKILILTDYLCERASRAGLEIYSSRNGHERSGIVSLVKPGADPKELMQQCRAAGVIVNCRANRLRVSPHAYNNIEEIDRFVDAIVD